MGFRTFGCCGGCLSHVFCPAVVTRYATHRTLQRTIDRSQDRREVRRVDTVIGPDGSDGDRTETTLTTVDEPPRDDDTVREIATSSAQGGRWIHRPDEHREVSRRLIGFETVHVDPDDPSTPVVGRRETFNVLLRRDDLWIEQASVLRWDYTALPYDFGSTYSDGTNRIREVRLDLDRVRRAAPPELSATDHRDGESSGAYSGSGIRGFLVSDVIDDAVLADDPGSAWSTLRSAGEGLDSISEFNRRFDDGPPTETWFRSDATDALFAVVQPPEDPSDVGHRAYRRTALALVTRAMQFGGRVPRIRSIDTDTDITYVERTLERVTVRVNMPFPATHARFDWGGIDEPDRVRVYHPEGELPDNIEQSGLLLHRSVRYRWRMIDSDPDGVESTTDDFEVQFGYDDPINEHSRPRLRRRAQSSLTGDVEDPDLPSFRHPSPAPLNYRLQRLHSDFRRRETASTIGRQAFPDGFSDHRLPISDLLHPPDGIMTSNEAGGVDLWAVDVIGAHPPRPRSTTLEITFEPGDLEIGPFTFDGLPHPDGGRDCQQHGCAYIASGETPPWVVDGLPALPVDRVISTCRLTHLRQTARSAVWTNGQPPPETDLGIQTREVRIDHGSPIGTRIDASTFEHGRPFTANQYDGRYHDLRSVVFGYRPPLPMQSLPAADHYRYWPIIGQFAIPKLNDQIATDTDTIASWIGNALDSDRFVVEIQTTFADEDGLETQRPVRSWVTPDGLVPLGDGETPRWIDPDATLLRVTVVLSAVTQSVTGSFSGRTDERPGASGTISDRGGVGGSYILGEASWTVDYRPVETIPLHPDRLPELTFAPGDVTNALDAGVRIPTGVFHDDDGGPGSFDVQYHVAARRPAAFTLRGPTQSGEDDGTDETDGG